MVTTDPWDPAQYNRFAAERAQPFFDLVSLLRPAEGPAVVDLGCGDGRLTARLHALSGASATLGIDSSTAMLAEADARPVPGVGFERGDIGAWERPGAYDVVFANASLQWVPDHAAVLGRLTRSLRPGGQLAVQVPANADHPAHTVAVSVAAEFLHAPAPDPVATNVLAPEAYAVLLDELGLGEQHVRLQVYAHRLPSTPAVVEWVKGTTLTRFKEPLGERWEPFLELYGERLAAVLGTRSPYLYPFKRILLWGRSP